MADASTDLNLAMTIQVLRDIQITKWTAVSGQALFTYDILLTWRNEYRYVWVAKWSSGKILYILVRYPLFIIVIISLYMNLVQSNVISDRHCQALTGVELFAGWLELIIAQVILGLRTVALYNLEYWIIVSLGLLGFVTAGTVLAFYVLIFNSTVYGGSPFGSAMVGCYRECPPCYIYHRVFLVPILVFDSAVFFLTLFKLNQLAIRSRGVKAPLLWVLYRDGFVYFATIFTVVLVNLILSNAGRRSQFETLTPFMRTMISLMCSRLLLNIRGALLQTSNETNTFSSESSSRPPRAKHVQASTNIGFWHSASSPSTLFARSTTPPQLGEYFPTEGAQQDGVRNDAQAFEMVPLSGTQVV